MITDILKIDGISYNVSITEISESFSILYSENTGRTMSQGARMTLDPLGTFFGHKVTVSRRGDKFDEFDTLYEYLSKPRLNGVKLEAIHGQTTIKYDAYVSQGERNLKKVNNGVAYWDAFSINFVPMEAQVIFGE